MNNFVDSLTKLFAALKEHPERGSELAEMIKELVNKNFPSTNCDKIFISRGSGTSRFIVSVIPQFPKFESVISTQFLTTYDIDINLRFFHDEGDAFDFEPIEYATWLLHELFANIITDTTYMRYKKNIIKYYDTNNSYIMSAIRVYGDLPRIGIFSNTEKDYVSGTSIDSPVNSMLTEFGVGGIWNSLLSKYIAKMGGSYNILSKEYIDRLDRAELRMFNEIARKYTTYVVKYDNTDYYTLIHYLIAETGSNLIKFYCEKEPKQIVSFEEKDSFNLFDDRKLLKDSETEGINFTKSKTIAEYNIEFEEIKKLLSNNTSNDNLLAIVKAKDLYNEISSRVTMGSHDDQYLIPLKTEIIEFINKMRRTIIDDKISVMDYKESIN